jgi:hypothetical protein
MAELGGVAQHFIGFPGLDDGPVGLRGLLIQQASRREAMKPDFLTIAPLRLSRVRWP